MFSRNPEMRRYTNLNFDKLIQKHMEMPEGRKTFSYNKETQIITCDDDYPIAVSVYNLGYYFAFNDMLITKIEDAGKYSYKISYETIEWTEE